MSWKRNVLFEWQQLGLLRRIPEGNLASVMELRHLRSVQGRAVWVWSLRSFRAAAAEEVDKEDKMK